MMWVGYLGVNVARRAMSEGYTVTSLSQQGNPQQHKRNWQNNKSNDNNEFVLVENNIDFWVDDALVGKTGQVILREVNYAAVVHCIWLLFNDNSGLSIGTFCGVFHYTRGATTLALHFHFCSRGRIDQYHWWILCGK